MDCVAQRRSTTLGGALSERISRAERDSVDITRPLKYIGHEFARPSRMHSLDTEIWNLGDDLWCATRPSGTGWGLYVVRGHHVVKSDWFPDAATALIAADVWRRRLDPSEETPAALEPSAQWTASTRTAILDEARFATRG